MDSNILEEEDINLPLEEFLKFIEGKDFNELQCREEPLIFELIGKGKFDIIGKGKFDIIERLFSSGKIDMTIRNSKGSTPFHVCSYNGNIKIVNFFLDMGVEIDIRDKRRLTPLHEACYGENIEMIKLLLDRGADIHAKMKWGNTPLFCVGNNIKVAELLLNRGADINEKEDSGLTQLHGACADQYMEMVEFLLQRGARVEYENDFPTCVNDRIYSLERNKEVLKLIDSYKGKNIKGGRRR